MKRIKEWIKNLRIRSAGYGYTCDACGEELFGYPARRLCEACERALMRNDAIKCDKCGRSAVTQGVCLTCKSTPPNFTLGVSPLIYHGKTASLINRVKNGNRRIAFFLGETLAAAWIAAGIEKHCPQPVLVLPVPLTAEKQRLRGYNQAEDIADALVHTLHAHGIDVEMHTDVLVKTRETKQQKHLGSESRAENVLGAYHVSRRKICRGRTIALVDDILTTGATGSECARLLLSAGAKAVYLLTAASLPENP